MKVKLPLLIVLVLPIGLLAQTFTPIRPLNSTYRETNMSITPNGQFLFYMSQRGGQSWSTDGYSSFGDKNVFDGDIWYSEKVDGKWQPPRVMKYPINTSMGEDEPSILMDGQTVYFQSWRPDWMSTGGPYYKAKLEGNEWKNPEGMGGQITTFFLNMSQAYEMHRLKNASWLDFFRSPNMTFGTDGMAVSPNGKIMVISVTNYLKRKMDMDLFISRKSASGKWSYPIALELNSNFDEISAFIAGDNETLYFASDRKGGKGGFDIYKVNLLKGKKTTSPVNVGSPYNTGLDDYGFIASSSDEKAYLIRNGNIYESTLTKKAKPKKTLIVNGIVKDEKGNPLRATIEVALDNKAIEELNSNSFSGKFSYSTIWNNGQLKHTVTLEDGRNQVLDLTLTDNTKSPLNLEVIFPVPEEKPKPAPEIKEDNTPKPIVTESIDKLGDTKLKAGTIIRVNNLYFKADKTAVEPASYALLDRIARILNERPNLTVEIGGHTNGIPPHEYCDKLSTNRAKAVYDYLVQKGVPGNQLFFKGYGKRKPIAVNNTDEGRKKNQRVEIKVLKVEEGQ